MWKLTGRTGATLSACGLIASIVTAGPAKAAEGPSQIRFVEHATTDATAHIGRGADNAGDILTFANEVFDADNQTKIGTDQGYCIRIVPGKSYECAWTLFLRDGQINVTGPFFDASDSILAVTGGGGKYNDVHGQMELHARDAKGSEYDFTYHLQHLPGH